MHVVVVGGGFGGLATAQALGGVAGFDVTLVDRRNHHLFQPLLYQVATAALSPSDIAEPIRAVLARRSNVKVRLGEVTEVDPGKKQLRIGDDDWVAYDKLVLALGATHSYFGNDAWAAHAPGLKTLGDALNIRARMLASFEQAEWTDDPTERDRLMTFVVIGGGPTGVELAGALSEIAMWTLRRDFRNIDTRDSRVVLLEAAPSVLRAFPDDLQAKARTALEGMNVEVRTDTMVTDVDARGVTVGQGERLDAGLVLWAAGVQGPPLVRDLGWPLDRAGRVQVQADLSVPGHEDIYVIGDMASLEQDGQLLPGVAPVAIAMGKQVAANLRRGEQAPFWFRDIGQMATIGRRRAVWKTPGGFLNLGGTLAWLAWVFVHLMVLVTYRSRLLVFIKWAWAYLTFDRASRLMWKA